MNRSDSSFTVSRNLDCLMIPSWFSHRRMVRVSTKTFALEIYRRKTCTFHCSLRHREYCPAIRSITSPPAWWTLCQPSGPCWTSRRILRWMASRFLKREQTLRLHAIPCWPNRMRKKCSDFLRGISSRTENQGGFGVTIKKARRCLKMPWRPH